MNQQTKYSIEDVGGITVTTFFVKVDLEITKRAMDNALKNWACILRLWDFAFGVDYSQEDVVEIATKGKAMWPAPSKGAIVVPDDLSFGVMRMHDVYREKEQLETRTFRKRQEAMAWLNEYRTFLSE